MDVRTKSALDHLKDDSKILSIYNDRSLSSNDIEKITGAVAKHKKLERLIFKDCGLEDWIIEVLVGVIASHPSLTSIDFSGNNFSTFTYLSKLVESAKRVHTLDISNGREAVHKDNMLKFLTAVRKSDSLAVLGVNGADIFPYDNKNSIFDFFGSGKNLYYIFRRSGSSTTALQSSLFSGRKNNIRLLYEGIFLGNKLECPSQRELIEIMEQIPSLLALAEEKEEKQKALKRLVQINEASLEKWGMSIGIELYLNEINYPQIAAAESLPAVAGETKQAAELPVLKDVVDKMPAYTKEEIRKQLEDGRSNPLLILDLGKEASSLIGSIALAGLGETTAHLESFSAPTRSMAEFVGKFQRAKELIARHAESLKEEKDQNKQAAPAKEDDKYDLIPNPDYPPWYFRFMLMGNSIPPEFIKVPKETPAEKLSLVAEAGELARESGKILQEIILALQGVEGSIKNQLISRQNTVTAFRRVAQQLSVAVETGESVLLEWRKETAEVTYVQSDKDPENFVLAGEQIEPFSVQNLDQRLRTLKEAKTGVDSRMALNLMYASMEAKQQEGFSAMNEQNIPLLAEQVTTFITQVQALERAAILNGVADATREAAQSEKDTTFLAAFATIQAIENLTTSAQEALKNMQEQAEQISRAIGDGPHKPDAEQKTIADLSGPSV